MTYLLLGLGTYFLVGLFQYAVTMPPWAWRLTTLAVSAAFVVASVPDRWYLCPAVSGIAVLAQHVEDLLLVKTDETRVGIVRRNR